MRQKLQLSLEEEAIALIMQNSESERKRGEFVSRALIEWDAQRSEVQRLRAQLAACQQELAIVKQLMQDALHR